MDENKKPDTIAVEAPSWDTVLADVSETFKDAECVTCDRVGAFIFGKYGLHCSFRPRLSGESENRVTVTPHGKSRTINIANGKDGSFTQFFFAKE